MEDGKVTFLKESQNWVEKTERSRYTGVRQKQTYFSNGVKEGGRKKRGRQGASRWSENAGELLLMVWSLHRVPSSWFSDASSSTVCKNKTITLHLVIPPGWGLAADLWCTDWIAWLGWQKHLDSPLWEAPSVCLACQSLCMAACDSVRVETRFPTWTPSWTDVPQSHPGPPGHFLCLQRMTWMRWRMLANHLFKSHISK